MRKETEDKVQLEHLFTGCAGDLGCSPWFKVDQAMIDQFGAATLDPDPMHIDNEWCEKYSPYKVPIAFGFFTLSMLSYLSHGIIERAYDSHIGTGGYPLNYGLDNVRFAAPVPVNSEIRLHLHLQDKYNKNEGQTVLNFKFAVEVKGQDEPALIGNWLGLWVQEPGHQRIASKNSKQVKTTGV
ncbi:MaoC/PaaZ C-terminal domain-containing protein [Kordiimonas lacus]|uniref:Acyl dehydratase n=1 Tax=Kordiimonas lacus TaxID=637679 RepID=A0A1G7F5G0_9PROT|nr:MaoC/PaaZ C-terminal domain-containing protein [Kordiimonas lacus]SDE71117.1 Acyl dehydratase [Kordiimonas lacus]